MFTIRVYFRFRSNEFPVSTSHDPVGCVTLAFGVSVQNSRKWSHLAKIERAAGIQVAEDRLEAVRYGITRGAAELRPFEFISQYGSQDASGRRSGGVIVCGYDFPELASFYLAAFFELAISELREAPR